MSDGIPPVHDYSRVDAYTRARRRVALLNASWRPLLAGAAGAALVVGAVAVGILATAPRFSFRDIEVPRISYREVTVPNIITKDVEVPVPRLVPSAPLAATPRNPDERRFVSTEGWRGAVIRGRILRPDQNGFTLMTDEGEKSFYPAKIGADGKPGPNTAVRDIIEPYLDDLGYCRELPLGAFECVALHKGQEVFIQQELISGKRGQPA